MSLTPAQIPLVPRVKRDTILSLLEEGKRLDNRRLDETRPITIEPGYIEKADGSALVKMGETVVLAGVKVELGTPYPDTPDEGIIMVNAEFVPVASPYFEPGPPDENAFELSRVIDRSLRETKAIKLDELVVTPGQKVMIVWDDIYILNHAGNLIDAASIATLAALATTRLPEVDTSGDQPVIKRFTYARELPIEKMVVTATIAKIADYYVVDPTDEEESVADSRLAISFVRDGTIAGIQKTGEGALTEKDIDEMIELAWNTAQKYFEKVEKAVSEYKRKTGMEKTSEGEKKGGEEEAGE